MTEKELEEMRAEKERRDSVQSSFTSRFKRDVTSSKYCYRSQLREAKGNEG